MHSINAGTSFDFALGPGQEVIPVSYSVKTENRSYKAKGEGVAGGRGVVYAKVTRGRAP